MAHGRPDTKYQLDLDRDLVSEDARIWLQASDESTHCISDTLRSSCIVEGQGYAKRLTVEGEGKKYNETRSGRFENASL